MKTILVNIPDKECEFFDQLIKRFGFTSFIISDEDKKELALSKWIGKGMKSKEVTEDVILKALKRNGVKI